MKRSSKNKMFLSLLLVCSLSVSLVELNRFIDVGNGNHFPIWIQTLGNNNAPPLSREINRINPGGRLRYEISDEGWAGRLWPKVGCDENGVNCEFGQSISPCSSGGCQPPADTKVEFFFPRQNSPDKSFYDISLVDGFSLASEIIPYHDDQPISDGFCVRTDCHVTLNQCPRSEISGLNDLTVIKGHGHSVACLSPCKKWNFPQPYGLKRSEQEGDGRLFCCPSPVPVDECRRGLITNTEYVNLVRRSCPTAYSYAYDDEAGLHNCPSTTSYIVNFYS